MEEIVIFPARNSGFSLCVRVGQNDTLPYASTNNIDDPIPQAGVDQSTIESWLSRNSNVL